MRATTVLLSALALAPAPAAAMPPNPHSAAADIPPFDAGGGAAPAGGLFGGLQVPQGLAPAGASHGWCFSNPAAIGAVIKSTESIDGATGRPPTLGVPTTYQVLVLRVQFADQAFTQSTATHVQWFTDVKRFWEENSYGLLSASFTVSDIYVSTNNRSRYGSIDCIQNTACKGNLDLLVDVASDTASNVLNGLGRTAQQDFDYGDFTHIMLFTAGFGEESSGSASDLWALYLPVRDETAPCVPAAGAQGFAMDDKCFDGVTFTSERETSGASPFGVLVHEYGHQLGAVDLYNTLFGTTVVDEWSVMDRGAWAGTPSGSQPSSLDAWHKVFMAFAVPVDVGDGLTNLTLTPSATSAYKIFKVEVPNSDVKPKEFLLLEQRRAAEPGALFDKAIPGDGILVWRIDESVGDPEQNNINIATRRRVQVIPADGTLPVGGSSDAGDPYPGSSNVVLDQPDNNIGNPGGVLLLNIGAGGGATQTISIFKDFNGPGALGVVAVSSTEVKYSWAAQAAEGASGYELLNSTGGLEVLLLPGGASEYVDITLTPNSLSDIRQIRTFITDVGSSAVSSFSPVYSHAALPTSITYVEPWADTSIKLGWSPNNNPSGTVYKVSHSTSVDFSAGPAVTNTTSPGSLTLTGLTPNTSYNVAIEAVNFDGVSVTSAIFGSTVTHASEPSDLRLQVAFVSSMTVEWGVNANPADTKFELIYSSDAFTQFLDTGPLTTASTLLFQDLAEEATYFFRVRALNRVGVPSAFTGAISVWMVPNSGAQPIDNANGTLLNFLNVELSVPPGAFGKDTSISLVVPKTFPAAVASVGSQMRPTGVGVQIDVDEALQPSKPLPITVRYTNPQSAGMIENRFVLARYIPEKQSWIPLPTTPITRDNLVRAQLDHLSLFQIMEYASNNTEIDDIVAFPNPLLASRGQTMSFTNVPPNSRLRIYTLTGEQVADVLAIGAVATWDGRNLAGHLVGSGVYVVLVQDDANNQKGTFRIMVER